jgi:hypothetical protein
MKYTTNHDTHTVSLEVNFEELRMLYLGVGHSNVLVRDFGFAPEDVLNMIQELLEAHDTMPNEWYYELKS